MTKKKILFIVSFLVLMGSIIAFGQAWADSHAVDGPVCVDKEWRKCDAWCTASGAWCNATTWTSYCPGTWYNYTGYRYSVECCNDYDCGYGKVCYTWTHTCVECLDSGDCGYGQVCDTANHKCVECLNDSDCGYNAKCDIPTKTCKTCNRYVSCNTSVTDAWNRKWYCRNMDNTGYKWVRPIYCTFNNFCQSFECAGGLSSARRGICSIDSTGNYFWEDTGSTYCPYSISVSRTFIPGGDRKYELTWDCQQSHTNCDKADAVVTVSGPQASTIVSNYQVKQHRVGPYPPYGTRDAFLNSTYWTPSGNTFQWHDASGNSQLTIDSSVCCAGCSAAPGNYTDYYYIGTRVRSANDVYSMDCSPTPPPPPPPSAPTNLSATAVSCSQINLSWTDNSNNETGFKIERKTGAGGAWSQIAAVGANVTAYNNTGLNENTTYFYRVRAYNGDGDSNYSNEDSATTPACNQSPSAANLQISQPDYCFFDLFAVYSWNFTDPDIEDGQSAYRVQTDNNPNFSSPEDDSGKINSSSNSYSIPLGKLSYNNTYYWRLKVWDSSGAESPWIYGPSFTTPKHAYPDVNFSWLPINPFPKESVQFTDQSTADGGASIIAWSWTFPDGNPAASSEQNPEVNFISSGTKTVVLQVTDSDGYSCPGTGEVNLQRPLPQWEEIKPF